MIPIGEPKFIVDHNAGKLVRWLRLMGYDALFFEGDDDHQMVTRALAEDRVILTRDSHIARLRVAITGRLKFLLLHSEKPEEQIRHVVSALKLDCQFRPFSICLECNQPLEEKSKEAVEDLVPPYVFKTQSQYRQCPVCHRVYWRGTHWQAMNKRLQRVCGIDR